MKSIYVKVICICLVCLLCAGLVACGGTEGEPEAQGNTVGDICYTQELEKFSGGTVDIKDLRGKVTVLNFWGEWCYWCLVEMPAFDVVADEYAEYINVVAIHSLNGMSEGVQYVKDNFADSKIIFVKDAYIDGNTYYGRLGGNGSYPRTVILDCDGKIVFQHYGALSYEQLSAYIEHFAGITLKDTESTSESQTESETVTESLTESETVTESQTESETVTESQTESETVTESQTESETVTESQTESETVTESQTESETVTESQTESETVTESQTESETVTESQTESETVTESQTESETVTESQTESETVTESQTESETVTESLTESETVTETESETETETEIIYGNKIGDICYDGAFETFSGETVNISDYRGKVTVINFWAEWCYPCCAELPAFDQAATEYENDVAFLAIHYISGMSAGIPYAQENFPNSKIIFLKDRLVDDLDYYGLMGCDGRIPRTIILDREGRILFSHYGAMDYETLVAYLEIFI